MAVVWAVPEDSVVQDWKEQLGEKLANQLTTCGYKSNLRGKRCNNCSSTVKGLNLHILVGSDGAVE
jgi:hypothetical protein